MKNPAASVKTNNMAEFREHVKKFGVENMALKYLISAEDVKNLVNSNIKDWKKVSSAKKSLGIGLPKIRYIKDLKEFCKNTDKTQWSNEIGLSVDIIEKILISGFEENMKISTAERKAIEKLSSTKDVLEDTKEFEEYMEERIEIEEAMEKNHNLICDLEKKRENFAGIGTNKAKRRLNKLAKENDIAKALRIALEIEDKSIVAKKYFGKYKEKNYDIKNELIIELIELFKKNRWVYGWHESDVFLTNKVMFFEIPGCEQISWHCYLDENYPKYEKDWDGKINSTLEKIEKCAATLFAKHV